MSLTNILSIVGDFYCKPPDSRLGLEFISADNLRLIERRPPCVPRSKETLFGHQVDG